MGCDFFQFYFSITDFGEKEKWLTAGRKPCFVRKSMSGTISKEMSEEYVTKTFPVGEEKIIQMFAVGRIVRYTPDFASYAVPPLGGFIV